METWGLEEYSKIENSIKRADVSIMRFIISRIKELERQLEHELHITEAQREWIKNHKRIYTDPELFIDEE